jgi:RNA polymerase sigma-70 factor (ECF subfamily)
LRHYADLPFREIAELMGAPLGTVLARGHRALKKLRAKLADEE